MPRPGMAFFLYSESSVIVRLPRNLPSFSQIVGPGSSRARVESFMIILGDLISYRLTAPLLLAGCLAANLWAQDSPTQTPPPNVAGATAESPLDHFQNFSALQ